MLRITCSRVMIGEEPPELAAIERRFFRFKTGIDFMCKGGLGKPWERDESSLRVSRGVREIVFFYTVDSFAEEFLFSNEVCVRVP